MFDSGEIGIVDLVNEVAEFVVFITALIVIKAGFTNQVIGFVVVKRPVFPVFIGEDRKTAKWVILVA